MTTCTADEIITFSGTDDPSIARSFADRQFVARLRDAVGYVDPRESVENQLWVALLYTCAVYRGVLEYPVRWPWATRVVGYVTAVDGRREPLISEPRVGR